MKIQVLGTGCARCKETFDHVSVAVQELGVAAEVEKVTDIKEIMKMGVMGLPGIVVDGRVVLTGSVPSVERVKELLSKAIQS